MVLGEHWLAADSEGRCGKHWRRYRNIGNDSACWELCNIALGRLCVCKQATGSWQVDSSVGVCLSRGMEEDEEEDEVQMRRVERPRWEANEEQDRKMGLEAKKRNGVSLEAPRWT